MLAALERLKQEQGSLTRKEWYYRFYLHSPHWVNLRTQKLLLVQTCEHCRINRANQAHHVRYKSIFDVQLDDLQAVCNHCHSKFHRIEYNTINAKRSLSKAAKIKRKFARLKRQFNQPLSPQQLSNYEHLMNRGRV